jgi:hypothetical protein
MEPQLGIVEEVERDEGDMFVLQRLVDMKVSLAAVEPEKRITVAIVFWKLQLVRCLDEVTALVDVVVTPSALC